MLQSQNRSVFSKVLDIWFDLLIVQVLVNAVIQLCKTLADQHKEKDDSFYVDDDFDSLEERDL